MKLGAPGRLARDLPRFLGSPLSTSHADELARRRLARRDAAFLDMIERMVYGYARSPYRALLKAAGCELGDLKNLVASDGVEGALERLAGAGVYVTLDEFKGRTPAVRGSQRFTFREEEFDNPFLPYHFAVRSGGTRSPGTVVKVNLRFITDRAVSTALAFQAHGLEAADHVIWLVPGITQMLIYARLGRAPIAWFYPVRPLPAAIRAGSWYLAALSRLSPTHLPVAAYLDLMEPHRLAAWLGARLPRGRQICVTTYASSAVRVADAARERGIPLEGVTFITLGEPFTEGKRQLLERAGARPLVRYAITEAGILGYQCAQPQGPDDLHLFTDAYAVLRRNQSVGADGPIVGAFLVSSLLPAAPKMLLNVESGDHGVLTRRPCGCGLGARGFLTHLSEIRSHEKLSGEGMTFVQTDLLRILEQVLPARFGGGAADFQVVEEESQGILRLLLIISPRVGQVDEVEARRVFLAELEKEGGTVGIGARMWARAGTVTVRRAWPIATKSGKILPFQLVRAHSA